MADLRNKIEIEIDNIDRIFEEIPSAENLHRLSTLELAGVATLLHNYYTGLENIVKAILIDKREEIPQSSSWHKDLLNKAVEKQVISNGLKDQLGEYLAFRHFFTHAYALDLYPTRMEPLIKTALQIYESFKIEIAQYIS